MRARTVIVLTAFSLTGCQLAVEFDRSRLSDDVVDAAVIDAGDAGIRATGNIQIGAQVVLNSSNISSGGTTTGATVAAPSAPSVSSVTSASNSSAASTASTPKPAENKQEANTTAADNSLPTVYTVEVIGYGGGSGDDEEDDEEKKSEQNPTP